MTQNGVSHVDHFLREVLRILKEEHVLETPSEVPVIHYSSPKELQACLDLQVGATQSSDEELTELCRQVARHSVKTSHPHFHNQLYAGVDPYGLAGAWVSEALNTNQYTFEVGPAFTLVENALLQHVLNLFGFPEGDAIFAPGGSISNMYALVLARYRLFPDIKTKGTTVLPPLVCFTSEDSHYSTLKAAHWLGIGTDHVIKVTTDGGGRMVAEDLERCITQARSEGKLPLCVVATSGTTVLGAFDRLQEMADVCARQDIWLHVDACWGGSLILSRTHKHLVQGIHRADSVSWNPHKMLGAPLQCSALLIKTKGLLHHCNSASASYLFQQDKFYDISYDTGDKSVQCGRKVDAFKLWLMWKARGDAGFEHLIDNTMECARYFRDKIMNRPGFRLVIKDIECTNVCFWYIPKSLRGQKENDEWWKNIYNVAPRLKEHLIRAGSLMLGYQPLSHKGLGNFFRMVTSCHPPPTHATMDHVIQEIENFGDLL